MKLGSPAEPTASGSERARRRQAPRALVGLLGGASATRLAALGPGSAAVRDDTVDLLDRLAAVPLFHSWWFYGGVGLALLALLGLVLRMRATGSARREERLQAEVAARTAELARLSRLTEVMNEAVSLEEVLDHIYEHLGALIPYDRLGLALLDESHIVLRAVWSRGRREASGIARGYEARLAGSSLERILETGEPRIIEDLERYAREHPESESTKRILSEGVRSNLTFPLRARGRAVGVIFFSSFQTGAYGPGDVELLRQVAGHLALIVDKSRLHDDLVATKLRLEEANRHLERLASADGLTGLANRRAFEDRLGIEWRRAGRGDHPLSLLLLDVDDFKAFNDGYGHLAGDDCLRAIAATLERQARRAGDMVARFGGEEFAFILPDCNSTDAMVIAERLRAALAALAIPHAYSRAGATVTVSVGVATVDQPGGAGRNQLVEMADRALYVAKRAGRNRVVFRGATEE